MSNEEIIETKVFADSTVSFFAPAKTAWIMEKYTTSDEHLPAGTTEKPEEHPVKVFP